MSNTFDAVFVQPKQRSSGLFDDASIGSYSPDTPVKAKSPLRVEVQDDDSDEMGRNNSLSSMSSLRRSVILDRLTQMTSDIQEQLQLDGYNEDEDEEEQEEDAGEVEEELDEDKHKEDDETEKESTDVEQGSSRDSDHEVHGFLLRNQVNSLLVTMIMMTTMMIMWNIIVQVMMVMLKVRTTITKMMIILHN